MYIGLLLNFRSSLYILDNNPLSQVGICKTFFLFCELTLYSIDCYLGCTKVLNFGKSNISVFSFITCAFGVYLGNYCKIQCNEAFLPCVSF